MKIILISEFGTSAGMEYLSRLLESKIPIEAIVLVGDSVDSSRLSLEVSRTGGLYRPKSLLEALGSSIVPVYFSRDINSEHCYSIVSSLKPDLMVSGITKVIRTGIIQLPTLGTLNCHTGLLPGYRGCSCVEWAILNNDPVGASCHFMVPKIDAGKVVYSEAMPILAEDRYPDVRRKMIEHQSKVMIEGVKLVINGLTQSLLPEQPLDKSPYFKPMKDEALIQKVVNKLSTEEYQASRQHAARVM